MLNTKYARRAFVGVVSGLAVAIFYNNCSSSFRSNSASSQAAATTTNANSGSNSSAGSNSSGGTSNSGTGGSTGGTSNGNTGGGSSGATMLAQSYPGDAGIASDPSVVWSEQFDEGSVSTFLSRYESYENEAGMSLVQDVPAGSAEKYSIQLRSDPTTGADATDFYKNFAKFSSGYDELYFRWYAKYQAGVTWHHTGVWFGGYNPPLNYPFPHAGVKPVGNDRFSIAIEPVWGSGAPNPQFDFYNYWMNMQTCSSCGGKYWGNELVDQTNFTADDNTWDCIEVHVKVNTDMSSAAGSMLEVWKNNNLVQSFSSSGPAGGWVQDHYCAAGDSSPQCQYSYTLPGPANLQVRTTNAMNINYFWPQNYITSGGPGDVWYSNMVVATKRIGCLSP